MIQVEPAWIYQYRMNYCVGRFAYIQSLINKIIDSCIPPMSAPKEARGFGGTHQCIQRLGPEAECEAREELKIFSKSFDKKKEVICAHFLFNCLYHGDCPGHFRKRG